MLQRRLLHSKRLTAQTSRAAATPVRRTSMDVSTYKDAAVRAAQEAGAIIKDAWGKPRNVMHKGDVDLVRDLPPKCDRTPRAAES